MTAQLVNHADPSTWEEASRPAEMQALTEHDTKLWRYRLWWERQCRAAWLPRMGPLP